MKEDFEIAKNELKQIGIIRIARDLIAEPIERNGKYWLHSPANEDKNASLLLREECGRFTDFSNGNRSGDCIGLVAYYDSCTQWQALQMLRHRYLLGNTHKRYDRQAIERERAAARRKKEAEQAFKQAWRRKTDELKAWLDVLISADEQGLYEVFSDEWCYCQDEKKKTEYQLDYLTNIPNKIKNPKEFEAWQQDCQRIFEEGK